MAIFVVFLPTFFILPASGYQFEQYQPIICPEKLNFIPQVDTVFLDLDNTSEVELRTCMLRNIFTKESVILIRGHQTEVVDKLRTFRTNENPNVLIMTRTISTSLLSSPAVKGVLTSHRSIVLIVLTDEEKFRCDNGTLAIDDFYLLENIMNILWHKHKITYVGITFPNSCREKIFIYSGKKFTNRILYDRTVKLIGIKNNEEAHKAITNTRYLLAEDYPLRANIFERFPTSSTRCENLHYYTKVNLSLTQGYCGLDGLVMGDIVRHFKFKLHFPNNTNCYKYGYVSGNNVTGSLGCIIHKELDISFNSRFMTQYSQDHIYFLHFIATDSLCVLVRRAKFVPLWLYAYAAYGPELWALIISLPIMVGIIMWATAKVKNKMRGRNRESLLFYIKDAFTSTMFGFSLERTTKLFMLRGTCLCCSIMFVAIYQGRINHMFTTLVRYENIKTLSKLYESGHTLYISPSMRALMENYISENVAVLKFLKLAEDIPENYTLGFILQREKSAILGRKQDSQMEINQYIDEFGKPLIYIIDECIYKYYLSYIARPDFPFYEELQRFMQSVGEAGLPIIYYKWTFDMYRTPAVAALRSEPRPFAKIKLKHQRVVYTLLIIGTLISIIVFLVELWMGKRNRVQLST